LARSYYEEDNLVEAQCAAEIALEVAQKYQSQHDEGLSKALLGAIRGRRGNLSIAQAEEMIKEGIDILKRLGLSPYVSFCYRLLGELYANGKRKKRAVEVLGKAKQMQEEMGMVYELKKTRDVLEGITG
jgi:tetratricopeptide (TPR) repeat protein